MQIERKRTGRTGGDKKELKEIKVIQVKQEVNKETKDELFLLATGLLTSNGNFRSRLRLGSKRRARSIGTLNRMEEGRLEKPVDGHKNLS